MGFSWREGLSVVVEATGLDSRFLSSKQKARASFFVNSASYDVRRHCKSPLSNSSHINMRVTPKYWSFCSRTTRALLQMPTGSGKTRTASELIAAHLNESGRRQVVWLANTRELCEQALQCVSDVWDHLGQKDCTFNNFGQYRKEHSFESS